MGYSWILPGRLAQGSRPDVADALLPFDTVVLAAYEIQPVSLPVPEILRVPLDDARPTLEELRAAHDVARQVARRVRDGRRVLSTCAMGRNRSGLVTGLALVSLGMDGDEAVRLIQASRRRALTNDWFAEAVRYAGRRRVA